MGKFVQSIRFELKFEDDTAKFTCRPMDRATAIKLFSLPDVPVLDKDGLQLIDKESKKPKTTKGPEAVELLTSAFAGHLESVEGLTDAAGAAIGKEAVLGNAYFVGLVMEASNEWSNRSIPSHDPKA